MKQLTTLLLSGLVILLSCNDSEVIDTEPKLVYQPFEIDIQNAIEIYSSATGTESNGRVMSDKDLPTWEDLLYEITVDGSFGYNAKAYFDADGIRDAGVMGFYLPEGINHSFGIFARHVLTVENLERALDAGLPVEYIDITNSLDELAIPDTTVAILKRGIAHNGFHFGKHHLTWMFGLTRINIIPPMPDTIRFFNAGALIGPALYDINVNNENNSDLQGQVLLEMESSNYGNLLVDLDTLPDDILHIRNVVRRMELFYYSPSHRKTSLVRKTEGVGTSELVYYTVNINIPFIETDENGEMDSAATSNAYWEITFDTDLYKRDTINLGDGG